LFYFHVAKAIESKWANNKHEGEKQEQIISEHGSSFQLILKIITQNGFLIALFF